MLSDFVILALIGALFFGLEPILSKRGLDAGGTWLQSTLMLLVVRVLLFWSALFAVAGPGGALSGLTPIAIGLFGIASVVATALGRPALYVGFDRVGSTVSNAFVNARPTFSVAFGAFFLAEPITPGLGFGVLLIVTGLFVVTLSKGGDIGGWSKYDLVYPLIAALAFSIGNVIRRFGFETTPTTVLQAVAVGETITFGVMVGYATVTRTEPVWNASLEAYGWFLGGTVLASLGFLAMFGALAAGPVSVVDSVIAAAPLVTTLVAIVFLRDIERVTGGLIVGVGLVVCGLILVALQPI